MDKIIEATYDGEVFRPDEQVDLPSDTKVKIHIEDEQSKKKPEKNKSEPYAFLKYLDSVSIDAPADYASNLDEYLYGGKSLE